MPLNKETKPNQTIYVLVILLSHLSVTRTSGYIYIVTSINSVSFIYYRHLSLSLSLSCSQSISTFTYKIRLSFKNET